MRAGRYKIHPLVAEHRCSGRSVQSREGVHLHQPPRIVFKFRQVGWVLPPAALELLEGFPDAQAFLNEGRHVGQKPGHGILPAIPSGGIANSVGQGFTLRVQHHDPGIQIWNIEFLAALLAGRIGGPGHGEGDLFREFRDFFRGKQTCFHVWQKTSEGAAVRIEDEHRRLSGQQSLFTGGFHVRPPGWPLCGSTTLFWHNRQFRGHGMLLSGSISSFIIGVQVARDS
jgi:hypothetical protein